MFKLHKPQLSGSIHSGHFMVSRLDDDDDDNIDPADDSSESERDNANSVEIDVNNPESVGASNIDITYQVQSPSAKNEHLTSWNDLDKPAKSSHQHQYLTYYTNSYNNETDSRSRTTVSVTSQVSSHSNDTLNINNSTNSSLQQGVLSTAAFIESNKELLARGFSANQINQIQQSHLQDQQVAAIREQQHQQNPHQLHHQEHNQLQQAHLNDSNNHQHHPHHTHMVIIDPSLAKLLECMSLYYSSKLTSPKWKSFKALKLRLKLKIRLNNLIWRAWFLQYIRGRRPPGCQFTAPVETDVHKKSETIVLEGKYWKRKEKAIVDEYKKWRIFHKQKSQLHCFRPSSFDWDSRVSNLASSSIYGSDCHFYPDYDMNIPYNLDDLPPMLEELASQDVYYQTTPQPQLSPQIAPTSTANKMIESVISQQQQQQQQQQQHQQQQQQQQQLQFTQMQVAAVSSQPDPLSLKREHTVLVNAEANQHQQQQQQQLLQQHQLQTSTQFPQQQQIPPQQQQHQSIVPLPLQQHQQQLQSSPDQHRPLPFNLASNPLYPQINEQIHPHLNIHHHSNHQQQQQQQQQQLLQQQQHHQQQQQQLQQPEASISPASCSGSQSNGGECVRDEQRRVCHINAEQKRRCNIKNGFDTLRSILPSINQSVNIKISKASMLQKAASYISTLTAEQKQLAEEQAALKHQIDTLKQTIRTYQCELPASGGPIGCQGSSQAREMLQDYIRRRTLENWKFWIFSLLIEPMFESYHSSVNATTLEEACKTIVNWLDRSCGLVSLRRDALESLTFLSTSTNILNTPQTLPTEAVEAVRYNHQTIGAPHQVTTGGSGSHAAPPAGSLPSALGHQTAPPKQQPQQYFSPHDF